MRQILPPTAKPYLQAQITQAQIERLQMVTVDPVVEKYAVKYAVKILR